MCTAMLEEAPSGKILFMCLEKDSQIKAKQFMWAQFSRGNIFQTATPDCGSSASRTTCSWLNCTAESRYKQRKMNDTEAHIAPKIRLNTA